MRCSGCGQEQRRAHVVAGRSALERARRPRHARRLRSRPISMSGQVAARAGRGRPPGRSRCPRSSAWPTLSAAMRLAQRARRSASCIAASTISRLDAVQRWPVEKYAPCTAQSTARSRSASASTTSGFLPPISSCTLARRAAAACSMRSPVGDRAGEADGIDQRAVHQRLAHLAAAAHHQVEDAGRQACAADDLGQRPAAGRHQFGRLEHHACCRRPAPARSSRPGWRTESSRRDQRRPRPPARA